MNCSAALTSSGRRRSIERDRFETWLKDHRRLAAMASLPLVVRIYGGTISRSTAYRVATKCRLRGNRLNRTRYGRFWEMINWRLPDGVLESIWGVRRGNVRQRRIRLQIGAPSYNARADAGHPQFISAVRCERLKAVVYTGPRPH